MTAPRDPATLLADARALAAAGDWERARALVVEQGDLAERRPELALLLGEAELRLGDPPAAIARLRGIAPALERSADGVALRRAANLLGAAYFEVGALDEARAAFARALELASADGDDLLVAQATNNLGAIANIRGAREQALAHYQLAVPAYQRLGSAIGLAQSFHNMAITHRDSRQLESADECERRALEYAREAGSARLQAMAQVGRAELSLLRGDARLADAGARRAAAEYAAIPDPVGEADAMRLAGAARAALGAYADALAALERAIALARAHASALVEAEALATRARLRAETGDRDAAHDDAAAAAHIFEAMGAQEELDAVRALAERLRA